MTQYHVTGMSCAACSARVEKAVSAVEGVESCAVSLLTNSMGVEGSASPEAVMKAVADAGYGASLKAAEKADASAPAADSLTDTETSRLLRRLLISLVFLLILMYVSMGHTMLGAPVPAFLEGNPVGLGLLQMLLAGIVMVINQRFFISGTKALLHRAPNMDTLVSLGAAASYIWSICVLFMMTDAQRRGDADTVSHLMHQFYFESAAMILTLITVGKTLEARAKGKTTDALKGLMRLAPKTAVILENGTEREIPAEQVQRGMHFAVRPGAQIPADGIVISGSGTVDESALTGESIPADKSAGDSVSAGTINQAGYLECEATKTGEDTTLFQIIRLVGDAAATKAPIAKTADKVSGIFVPAVIGIALVTFLIWILLGRGAGFALARGVSVLVISCPCALGLATPVAIMVGSGVGARSGILYKTAAALEETGRIQTVVLDKTGTVTEGKPRVTDVIPAEGFTEMQLLTDAAALEQHSEHPLGRAVSEYAAQQGIVPPAVTEFAAQIGSGVSAKNHDTLLLACSQQTAETHITLPEHITKTAHQLAESGKTPLFFLRGGKLTGIIAVADTIKPDSRAAVDALHQMGITVVMMTGDNRRTAAAIGREAGIDRVSAEFLPADKENMIRELARQGKVCMIGDGINDAPALTRADIGMAIGAGTDVAIDSADVVLMQSSLTDAVNAIRLSRRTLRNIRENLFWAFIYNLIGIPVASGALVPLGLTLNPMFGAAAMSLSSFCVVTNALRLNLFKPEKPVQAANPSATDTVNEISKGTVNQMANTTLEIRGMMCPHCEAHVRKALEGMEGVTVVSVSHEAANAVVGTAQPVTEDAFRAVIADAGYELTGIR
ncbi:MAG: heavy metal translocating P-type ATPase [Oscillospiraceae bacterium]|nr:heavy metal translocating P-type ATPase [Oscillospiraceae bacterium]